MANPYFSRNQKVYIIPLRKTGRILQIKTENGVIQYLVVIDKSKKSSKKVQNANKQWFEEEMLEDTN